MLAYKGGCTVLPRDWGNVQRFILQVTLLLALALLILAGTLLVRHVLNLPFRATNDALHARDSSFTLDFLIPGGTYVDESMPIGEVIRLRLHQKASPMEKLVRTISERIPASYRFLGDVLLWVFWSLCFMLFFRVFTFMAYGRAFRASLLFGAITYWFFPDFSAGRSDDSLFLGLAVLLIALRLYTVRKKSRKVFVSRRPMDSVA